MFVCSIRLRNSHCQNARQRRESRAGATMLNLWLDRGIVFLVGVLAGSIGCAVLVPLTIDWHLLEHFAATVLPSAMWPFSLVLVAMILRKQLSHLLGKMTSAKYGDLEFI